MKTTRPDWKRWSVGTRALTWVLRVCGALLLGGTALGQSLVNGGSVDGALSAPGERHTYTFDTVSRDRFTLRLVDVTGSGFTPRIELINPHGDLIQLDESPDVAMIETTRVMGGATFASGTYTVVVSHASTATFQPGEYELHFVKFPEAGVQLLDGLTVFDELRPGELRVFKYEAEAGQIIRGRIEIFQGSTLHILKEHYGPTNGYSVSTGGSVITFSSSTIPGGTSYILLSDSRGTGTGPFSIVVEGLSAAPPEPPNIFHPPYHALDPKLRDIGGHPGLGPRIGDRREPFNVAIDCTFMESPSLYSISMWTGARTGQSTPWGILYTTGQRLLRKSGQHTQSVEAWFSPDTGLPLPDDPSLVGLNFTVQGMCAGGLGEWSVRLSEAIQQTIGGGA